MCCIRLALVLPVFNFIFVSFIVFVFNLVVI